MFRAVIKLIKLIIALIEDRLAYRYSAIIVDKNLPSEFYTSLQTGCSILIQIHTYI